MSRGNFQNYRYGGNNNGFNGQGPRRDYGNSFNGQGPLREYAENSRPYVKKSRCTIKSSYVKGRGTSNEERVDDICVSGWNASIGSFVAVPGGTPSSNERWVSMVVTIEPNGGQKFITNGFWDNTNKRLRMNDFNGGMIANPYAPNGGVWCRGGHPMKKTIERNQARQQNGRR